MNESISTKNLSVFYAGTPAVQEIDFLAAPGEFVVIVGKSGSGKSSLLHALAGLIPSSGKINKPKRIGLVLQHSALFPWLSVQANISFGLQKTPKLVRTQIVEEHLRLTGLQDKRTSYPNQLSGGQIQRVALARSMAPNPEVLLMDEPYGALDTYTRAQMQKWLLDVWEKHKTTVVFVTHDTEEAAFLADRILVLDQGKFIAEFAVPFVRPRQEQIKFDPEFVKLRAKVLEAIHKS